MSRVGQFHEEGLLVQEPGYQVALDDGRWVTVMWNAVIDARWGLMV